MSRTTLPPVTPGEVLKEEFMVPLGVSMNALAQELHVAANRISQIVSGDRALTADTALRLSAFFDTTPEFWMNLQSSYDLEVARKAKATIIQTQVRKLKPRAPVPV